MREKVNESGSKWYVNQNEESTVRIASKAHVKPQDRKAHFCILCFSAELASILK